MFKTLLIAEFLKLKRQWIWLIMILGPTGILALQAVYFLFRYDIIAENYDGMMWEALSMYIMDFSPAVLILGVSIITSMLANTEHAENSLKQLLALPISKWQLFMAKFITGFSLLLTSCTILFFGTIILGLILGFGSDINFELIGIVTFFPFFAATPILALQIWLALLFKNQGIALSVGIFSAVIIMISDNMPLWLPVVWPTLPAYKPLFIVISGLLLGTLMCTLAAIHFVRKDV